MKISEIIFQNVEEKKQTKKPQHKVLGAQQLQVADNTLLTKTTVSHS